MPVMSDDPPHHVREAAPARQVEPYDDGRARDADVERALVVAVHHPCRPRGKLRDALAPLGPLRLLPGGTEELPVEMDQRQGKPPREAPGQPALAGPPARRPAE